MMVYVLPTGSLSESKTHIATPHENGTPKLTIFSSLKKTYTEFVSHLLNDTCQEITFRLKKKIRKKNTEKNIRESWKFVSPQSQITM